MAAMAPPQVVQGAPRAPLPFGLFSLLGFRGDEDRWYSGVVFESLTCEPAGGIGARDCDPEVETIGLPKVFDQGMGTLGAATPFTVYGHHTCSPIGGTFDRAQAIADQHLQVREEARVEQALWTGDLGNVPNFAGANEQDAPVNVGTFGPKAAVARLELEIARQYGSLGVLHMSREVAALAGLEARGGRLFTKMGTPVVAGTGYESDRIVATAPLFGYRSEVLTSSNRPGDLLDRGSNDLYAIAERTYLLGFDDCALLEATVAADPTTPTTP